MNLARKTLILLVHFLFLIPGCSNRGNVETVERWTTYELVLTAESAYDNPYTDIDVWTKFSNDAGDTLIRPAFWDGGKVWKVRFAPPDTGRIWTWVSYTSREDGGLRGKTGSIKSVAYQGDNRLLKHGLLKMSPGKRNVVHADSTPFLVVGDTPWSIPFRATTDQVTTYAEDRRQKGFNTALLITLQPDKNAKGPEARNTPLGFDKAFEDLHTGSLKKLKPDYFQTLDSLVQILLAHELVPLYAPFAHGYGWKGETAIGSEASPEEYIRYCKYLVARYGSQPAFWLVNLDGNALAAGVKPGGEAIEKWDAYEQPVGLHYSPYDDYIASWAKGDSSCCFHYNRQYQAEPWLDFQWAQTGHDGIHMYHKVVRMYGNEPIKASMNGEPTYEGMGNGKLGLGWWQGEDAWMQLMHGGTMGVAYGAACLWQWKVTPDEPGWPDWTNAPMSWREALDLEGGKYVGFVSKAFDGYNFTDMQKRSDLTAGKHLLLAREGKFYVSYLPEGGSIKIDSIPTRLPYVWFDPVTGQFEEGKNVTTNGVFKSPDQKPWVLIVGEKTDL